MRALLLLFLLLAGTAHAQHITQNGSCPAGASCTVSGTWTFNGGFGVAGWTPSYGALLISAGAPVAAGTGYNVGDTITLAGGTCSTQPIVAVTSLTGGAGTGVANFWVSNPGVCSIPPIGTLAQASSSGPGLGATVALSWGPYTPSPTSALLGFGGGNYYAGGTGNEAAGYANLTGAKVTYVGVRAGSNATGSFNSAFGLSAFGTGAAGVGGYTTPSGNGNSAFGTDCMRNVSGAAANNSCFGYGALASTGTLLTGNNLTAFGTSAGGIVTSASRSILIGSSVASTTFSTGSYAIFMGNDTVTDSYSAGSSFLVNIGGGKAGTSDVFVGYGSGGTASADGNGNTAVGRAAGASWTSATASSAFGWNAGQNATGSYNTYVGVLAGQSAGAGVGQVFVGQGAGLSISASNTTMLGTNAGRNGTSACSSSVGVGRNALLLCAGTANIGIGDYAINGLAAGNTMTALGANVGPSCVTSSGSILIGFSNAVDCPASNTSNWLNIGNAIRATLVKPTISSGFGTSPTVPSGTSSAVFTVNVGTGGTATSGVVLFATAAPTGWACSVTDQTNPGPNKTMVSASTTTTATFSNYSQTTGIAAAWSASDILVAQCNGY